MRGLVLLTLITTGCGAKSTCVPGQSAACVCSDGSGGAQVCRGDGTFGVCQCGTAVGNGGNGNGGGGGGGGGTTIGGDDMATGSVSTGQKRVFVTSQAYAGSVADSICQTVADSVSLGGTWVAWLSSANSTTPDAIDRIKGTGPWVLLDGTVAFANHAQLGTSPTAAIMVTETGQKLPGPVSVWTGTLSGGVHSGQDCAGWATTSSSYAGEIGSTTVGAWTASGQAFQCSDTERVYCFEQ